MRSAPSWLRRRRLRAERELERVFEMSPTLLGVAGFDGYLRRFNPAFEVFGYSREELLTRPWIEFAHPDDRERMMQAMASLERGDDVVNLENRVVCRDGSVRAVEWSTRIVPEEELFYAAGRDVTESRRAAMEQAALRRVATLVARECSQEEIFTAVAEGVAGALGEELRLVRFEGDAAVVVATSDGPHMGVLPVGTRLPVGGNNALSHVFRTGEPTRIDDYSTASGPIAEEVRPTGLRSIVATPIVLEARTWGAMIVGTFGEHPVPAGTEGRLGKFAELMATGIANSESRAEIKRLAGQDAALRRIATLIAQGAKPDQVFAAVTDETAATFNAITAVLRFEDDPPAVVIAGVSA